jgi:hypothetical protein
MALAFTATDAPFAFLLGLPLMALLAYFAHERCHRRADRGLVGSATARPGRVVPGRRSRVNLMEVKRR